MVNKTTIQVEKETLELLQTIKVHPREPNEEVILRLISKKKEGEKSVLHD